MKLLHRLIYLILALVLVAVGGFIVAVVVAPVSTVGQVAFDRRLAVPPLAPSRIDAHGARVFELTAQAGTAELLPGRRTPTWGFNGSYLGPTLRADRGERVRVNVRNGLDETTSVHWHGMHLPAEADGGPHQSVEPGDRWTASWIVDQPAATLWYHPHPHGMTEEHVNRGLAGMFIVDDPNSMAADRLPNRYGVDDVPVIVQDKRLGRSGRLRPGGLGGDLLVNGTFGPYLEVSTEKVRLRVLNASVKRVYNFKISDGSLFDLIGTDGGLLPSPASMSEVQLSPGERAEIVVSMTPGKDVVLLSSDPDLGSDAVSERFNGGADEFDVLELRPAAELLPSASIPKRIAPPPSLDVSGATTRTFELRGREINGRKMDMSRIDETVELGDTEIWEVTNVAGEHHNFHVHDVQFQVLSVNGRKPRPDLSGWKDTVFMPSNRTVRLALRFSDYADADTPYMFHCHLLQHEDQGMMGQFVVVEPGESAGQPARHVH